MYSRSFFRALFPEIASPYLQDLVERFPDILAYYFLAFDIKTPSPTIITAASRIYANISAISAGFEGAGIRRELFCCSYLPRQKVLFKESRNKPSLFLAKRITSQEIDTLLNEINSSIKNKGAYAIFNDDFYEELPRISFTALFLNFLFMEGFAYLKSLSELEDIEILRGIFASRKNSFFITGQRLQIPEFFDPAYPEANIEFTPPLAEVVSAEALFSKLSPFKRFLRREKIIRALNVMHSALDGRDKLLKIAAEFHKTTRSALLEHGRYIKSRKKFLDENHVFLFESADIRRLANDSYYSNIEPALEYKKNFIRRCAAQAAVYDIYEEDIKYFGLIAEKQTAQVSEGVKLSCLSLGGNEEIRGVCSTNPDEGELSCLKIPNLASLSCLKTPNALICDLAPLFSYVTEYCVINKIPLYYSVRFPELLSGKRLTLHKGDIEINVVNK
ncbi:MAG: hypothetical protein LBD73_03120 [Deferribacteraceae bacterium]|nr:hypothetical protein [Deferribacteraceae bacterium]